MVIDFLNYEKFIAHGALMTDIRRRPTPRISANDLARYMVSTESGKIGIIRRARESSTPGRIRYTDAKDILKAALIDPAGERRIIAAGRDMFDQRVDDASLSDFVRDDAAKSLDAFDAFDRMRNEIAGFDYQPAPKRQPKLTLADVPVSVYADVLIHRDYRGVGQIGGAIFRMTLPDEEEGESATTKRREMGLYAATLVQMHIRENLAGNRTPAHQLCWAIDVQCGEKHIAPRTYAQRAQNLENACRFIAAMWDRV